MPHATRISWIVATVLTLGIGFATPATAQVRAALTRDMDAPMRGTRHVESILLNFDSNAFSVSDTVTPPIPSNKRLFIQSISMHTLLTDGQGLMEARFTILPGGTIRFWVANVFQAAGDQQRHLTGNLAVDMLLAPGESINIFLFRNDNLGSGSLNFARVTILGYLIDANP